MQRQYYEEYVKKDIGIPYVNFSELDITVIKDIVEALEVVIQKFPALKNSICSIGNNEDINNQYNMVINSNKFKKIKWDDFVISNGEKMSTVSVGTHIPLFKNGSIFEIKSFIALAYGNLLIEKNIEELNLEAKYNSDTGYHPKHCNTFKSVIYHEIGHVLDFILNLSKDKKLYALIKEKSDGFQTIHTKISLYALQPKLEDIIAEAFAEYMVCSNANDLINSIGDYILRKYKDFEQSKIFMINNKFSNHLVSEQQNRMAKK